MGEWQWLLLLSSLIAGVHVGLWARHQRNKSAALFIYEADPKKDKLQRN